MSEILLSKNLMGNKLVADFLVQYSNDGILKIFDEMSMKEALRISETLYRKYLEV